MEFILNNTLFDRLQQLKDVYQYKWNFRFFTRFLQEDPEHTANLEQKWGKKTISKFSWNPAIAIVVF